MPAAPRSQLVRSGGGEADPVAESAAGQPPPRPEPVEQPRARAYGRQLRLTPPAASWCDRVVAKLTP